MSENCVLSRKLSHEEVSSSSDTHFDIVFLFFKKKDFFYFYFCVWVWWVKEPTGSDNGDSSTEAGAIGICEPPTQVLGTNQVFLKGTDLSWLPSHLSSPQCCISQSSPQILLVLQRGGGIFSGDNRCFSIFRKCSGLGEHMELRITCAYCSGPKITYLEAVSICGIVSVKCQWWSQCSWLISTGAWDGWSWGRVKVVGTGVSGPFWSSALWENALLTYATHLILFLCFCFCTHSEVWNKSKKNYLHKSFFFFFKSFINWVKASGTNKTRNSYTTSHLLSMKNVIHLMHFGGGDPQNGHVPPMPTSFMNRTASGKNGHGPVLPDA